MVTNETLAEGRDLRVKLSPHAPAIAALENERQLFHMVVNGVDRELKNLGHKHSVAFPDAGLTFQTG